MASDRCIDAGRKALPTKTLIQSTYPPSRRDRPPGGRDANTRASTTLDAKLLPSVIHRTPKSLCLCSTLNRPRGTLMLASSAPATV